MMNKDMIKAIEQGVESVVKKTTEAVTEIAYKKGFEDGVIEGMTALKKNLIDERWIPPLKKESGARDSNKKQ